MFQTALVPNGLAAGLLVFSLGGLLLGRNTVFVALILGWVWANIASAIIIESRPNSVYLNKPVEITGRVLGMPGLQKRRAAATPNTGFIHAPNSF